MNHFHSTMLQQLSLRRAVEKKHFDQKNNL